MDRLSADAAVQGTAVVLRVGPPVKTLPAMRFTVIALSPCRDQFEFMSLDIAG